MKPSNSQLFLDAAVAVISFQGQIGTIFMFFSKKVQKMLAPVHSKSFID